MKNNCRILSKLNQLDFPSSFCQRQGVSARPSFSTSPEFPSRFVLPILEVDGQIATAGRVFSGNLKKKNTINLNHPKPLLLPTQLDLHPFPMLLLLLSQVLVFFVNKAEPIQLVVDIEVGILPRIYILVFGALK